jgi:CRISPR-associated protein Cas1
MTLQEKLDAAETINEIMGIEGICAKIYWGCFKKLLKYPSFTRRDYRPAPDYVNSALNLGYAFLANEITTQLFIHQFDVEIGFLHSIHYGRNSLTLDIMEEFRSPFVDGWLLGLFNRKILKEDHFKDEKEGFYLTESGFEKFCSLYHDHVEEENWREKFRIQAENLKKAVMAEGIYSPFIHE